jgi:hypothetical protein
MRGDACGRTEEEELRTKNCNHRVGEANVVWLSLNLLEAYLTQETIFWLPDAFADGGGTKGAS